MFCSNCGQTVAASDSTCANCGRAPYRRSVANPVLIAITVILAFTTVTAAGLALYYKGQMDDLQVMMRIVTEPPPPPPSKGAEVGSTTVAQPCETSAVGGVSGGVPGSQASGAIGGIVQEAPTSPAKTKRVPEPPPAPPQLISQGTPVYPPMAKMARVQGPVVVKALIDKQGRVARACLISGHPMLAQAAVDAVRQWRYKPYRLNGEAVEIETTATVNFKLSQ